MKITINQIAKYLPFGIDIQLKKHFLTYGKTDKMPLSGLNFNVNCWQYELIDYNKDDLVHIEMGAKGFFPLLNALDNLKKDERMLYEIAIISDNHFKERLQVDQYKIFEEDGCVVCQVHWVDKRNKYFEIAWSKEYNDGNEMCSEITMTLGAVGSVFNTDKIFDLLHQNHYDTQRLIEKGLAKQK